MATKVNMQAVAMFVETLHDASGAVEKASQARDNVKGIYTIGLEAAHLCGDAEAFEATEAFLRDLVTMGKKYENRVLATWIGAEKREEAGKNGEKYKLPKSYSNVMSIARAAYERGVPLVDKDGKIVNYGDLAKTLKVLREGERAESVKELTGIDRLAAECHLAIKAKNGKELMAWLKAQTPVVLESMRQSLQSGSAMVVPEAVTPTADDTLQAALEASVANIAAAPVIATTAEKTPRKRRGRQAASAASAKAA